MGEKVERNQRSWNRVGWELPGSDIGGAMRVARDDVLLLNEELFGTRILKITGYRQEFPLKTSRVLVSHNMHPAVCFHVMFLFGTEGFCDDSVLNTQHVCWRNLRNNILKLGDVLV